MIILPFSDKKRHGDLCLRLRKQKKAMLVRFNPKTDLHVKVIVKYDLRLSRANITFSGLFAFPAFTSGLFCHVLLNFFL
ncbi:hypothetical protein NC653_015849 [Populus alba x Populus x berolinensis]|uniref:Uncharacterized protein n=2 Tax=Populus alba x Populus x berolinensis TaxID=444605 RepID=A0AAD6QLG4_9ROSI|nr:hypothetical protein NC653_015849 [Populus alba x Populus x berolinensis]